MRFKAKCIDDKAVEPLQTVKAVRSNASHVRHIGKTADTVAKNRQPSMHHTKRPYFHLADMHNLTGPDASQRNAGHPRIGMLSEAIRQSRLQIIGTVVLDIYVDVTVHTKRTEVVQTTDMVIMLMGDENCVQTPEIDRKHLGPEVRATVEQQTASIIGVKQGRGTQTTVTRISRATNLTSTTDLWHAGTCARA